MVPLCGCCLSRDRVLSRLQPSLQHVLRDIICKGTTLKDVADMNICWECTALLRNVFQFKQRVARAREWFTWACAQQNTEIYSTVTPLTTLQSTVKATHNFDFTSDHNSLELEELTEIKIKKIDPFENFIEIIPEYDIFDAADTPFNAENSDIFITEPDERDSIEHLRTNACKLKKNVKKKQKKKDQEMGIEGQVNGQLGRNKHKKKAKKNENKKENLPKLKNNILQTSEEAELLKLLNEGSFDIPYKSQTTRQKPHHCIDCGLKFSYRCNLIDHSRTHTGEKPHKCDHCGKKYTQMASLNRHIRSHTGDKRYKCQFCGLSFLEGRSLTDHRNIHTGEKPYLCSACGKRFTQRAALRTHAKIHGLYDCKKCRKSFKTRMELKQHSVGECRL